MKKENTRSSIQITRTTLTELRKVKANDEFKSYDDLVKALVEKWRKA